MKGITHFACGVAAASCIPSAVASAAEGSPLYFILGGVFGILPDTLDFKFYRFCYRHDMEIRPDPKAFDAQIIADGVAYAVRTSYLLEKPIRLKLATVQLDDDEWQSYQITFDVARRKVDVVMGATVDTGGNKETVARNKEYANRHGSADLMVGIKLDYFADISVDILDGPVVGFIPAGDRVNLSFLPWHRSWTHSLVVALIAGLMCWLIFGMTAGFVTFAAYALHIMMDQLGFMGSNLWFPFSKARTLGAMRLRSGDAFSNFAFIWLACMIIFWNLYAGATWQMEGLTVVKFMFWTVMLPLGLHNILSLRLFKNKQ